MTRKILRRLSPMLGLSLVLVSGCVKSVCEGDNDCPSDKYCSETKQCAPGCRKSSDCPSDNLCVSHVCWPMNSSAARADGAAEVRGPEVCSLDDGRPDDSGPDDGGGPANGGGPDGGGGADSGGALVCSCSHAPHACLLDINPASSTAGRSVCEPGDPPRATLMFFGNVGCSHCQNIFNQLLVIASQLRGEGFDPTMAFIQLKTYDYTGKEETVTSTFPTYRGPVLQDTADDMMWEAYSADWYEVKIIDTHGCLSALFASPDTMSMIAGDRLLTAGILVKEAWISAMGNECHASVDAGMATGSGL